MILKELAAACGATLRGDGSVSVGAITHRAQDVSPGSLFAALPGERYHGLEFLSLALARGACAVLSDRDPGPGLPWLKTDQPRRATALAAWALAGYPQRHLQVVGVTGTNGKSTVVDLTSRIATAAGKVSGQFTTVAYTLPHRTLAATHTTPEATLLAPLLAELVDQGGTFAAVEVSSHALALDRVAGLELDVAVWTNLTRDHLDFHRTMEAYFAAKRRLEEYLRAPTGRRVINGDDPRLAPLLAQPRQGDLTFGLAPGHHVTATITARTLEGSRFTLVTPAGKVDASLPLVGTHNVLNALAAATVGVALEWPLEAIAAGLQQARPVPGRLELVPTNTPYPIFVDYAHTPDALAKVLSALREVSDRRLIVVFGAGGDKDQGKRAPMGEVAGRLADVPIVTSDNPRSEDPQTIIAAVMEGVRRAGNPRALAIPDRREAIGAAVAMADARCLVLIAGKGHETFQTFADRQVPFDDRQVARELAHRRRG